MSEEQINYEAPVGQPSPGGKYTEMVPANPLPKEDFGDETFSSDNIGIREAADQVATRREETKEERQAKAPIERPYQQQGGPNTGERSPTNQRVGVEQAAHDLTQIRQQEQAQEIAAVEELLRNQIDGERGVQTSEALGVEAQLDAKAGEQQQPQPQEQAQQEQPAPENVWERPEVIQAVSEYNSQVTAGVEQLNAKYISELQANAGQATAAIFGVKYPELAGARSQEELIGRINAISQQNPERGRQAINDIKTVQQLSAKAQEVQHQQIQAQHQQHQEAFQRAATLADDAYDKWITQQEPDAGRRQEISTTAHQMLRDAGLSEQELTYHWQTSPILRSFTGQMILAKAAKWDLAQRGAKTKAIRAVPTVQRPGSPLAHEPQERFDLRQLESRLNQSGSPRDAAALLSARRGARR